MRRELRESVRELFSFCCGYCGGEESAREKDGGQNSRQESSGEKGGDGESEEAGRDGVEIK